MNHHVFQTRFALIMTTVTLAGLAVLSVWYNDNDHPESFHTMNHSPRWLQDNNNDNDDDDDNDDNNNANGDYSNYSCNNLYSIVPNAGEAQCHFARTCNQGVGVWAPLVFCMHDHAVLSFHSLLGILTPIVLLWLVLLFRLLGSTAEEYFSPALEMFSIKLGLPPRFAGVSLLALGNGAADVSATVSAITNDPEHGYLLSLGALTGAAMVISSVVSALVVLVAGGVPCRGALVRDVAALGVAVLLVWYQLGGRLSTGIVHSDAGTVGPETVTLFLSSYILFVVLVLCADVYHRAVVVPRRRERAHAAERQRQVQEAQQVVQQQQQQQQAGAAAADQQPGEQAADPQPPQTDAPPASRRPHRSLSAVVTAFSNYDNPDPNNNTTTTTALLSNPHAWRGVDSDEMAHERPVMLHGSQGLLTTLQQPSSAQQQQSSEQAQPQAQDTPYTMMEDAMDQTDVTLPGPTDGVLLQVGGGLQPTSPSHWMDGTATTRVSWRESFELALIELKHTADQQWEDIAYNGDLDIVTKWLMMLETPFVVMRKITVPIPCEGFYNRSLIALSVALSPPWIGWYCHSNLHVWVWNRSWFYGYWMTTVVVALAVLRHGPPSPSTTLVPQQASSNGDGSLLVSPPPPSEMNLWVATPLALYGFGVAATWIDTIANALVSLLDFIGIVLRIPGPIVGLTILAWGNSMSDLSANMTMARKGLANMAMTACFAGPFFNFLVGLGAGFSTLAAKTGQVERQVQLEPAITTGFWFLALNSLVLLVTGLCWNHHPPSQHNNSSTTTTTDAPATPGEPVTPTTTTTSPPPPEGGGGGGRIPKKYGYIAVRGKKQTKHARRSATKRIIDSCLTCVCMCVAILYLSE